jgi:hypothetical protein
VGEESGDRGWALERFDNGVELGSGALIIGVGCCFSLDLSTSRSQHGRESAEFCWSVVYFPSLFVYDVHFREHIGLSFGCWHLP